MYKTICLIAFFLLSLPATAQLNKTSDWQVSGVWGPFIPTAEGFNEVLTANGVRINKGLSYYRPEISYIEASKDSEEFSYLALSMKNPIEIEDLEEIRPFMIVGLQWSQYSNPTSGGKKTGRGFHLAAGFEYVLTSSVVFRNDLYFGNGPKKQLLVGLSLQIEFGTEK